MFVPKRFRKVSESYKIGKCDNYLDSVVVGIVAFIMCMVFTPFLILFAFIFLFAGLTGYIKSVKNVKVVPLATINNPFKGE